MPKKDKKAFGVLFKRPVKEREAASMIEDYVKSHDFKHYINPVEGLSVRIEATVLDRPPFRVVPDFMDRMGAVAQVVERDCRNGGFNFHKRIGPNEDARQLELFFNGIPLFVVSDSHGLIVCANEPFPIEGIRL